MQPYAKIVMQNFVFGRKSLLSRYSYMTLQDWDIFWKQDSDFMLNWEREKEKAPIFSLTTDEVRIALARAMIEPIKNSMKLYNYG